MSLEKYRILLWKNWTIQKRHYKSGIFEVILPVIFIFFFSWIKSTYGPDVESGIYSSVYRFDPLDSCYLTNGLLTKVVYSPTSPWIDEFLRNAIDAPSLIETLEFESFEDSHRLDEFLNTEKPGTIIGIEFDDSLKVKLLI